MDSFTTQISQLRASVAAILAQVDGLAASATAIPTATPVATPLVFPAVPGTAVGAGLPPTEGGRSIEWYEAELAALSLPIPPRIQAQQTLGVATPATFGSVEANAAHYLLGKALYEPSQAQLEAEDAAYKAWREAMVASNSAPYGKVGAARAAERAAHWALKDASNAVLNAKQLVERFQDYNDGTFASRSCYRGGGTYFIYRFFVFEALDGYYTSAATWKPIGLLNPHAYNAYKASRARGKTFVDFVDDSQPVPDVVAYWRAIFDMEKDDESLPPCEDDDEAVPPVHPYPNGLRLKEQPLVQVAMGGGGGGPSEAVYAPAPAPAPAPAHVPIASLPPIPFLPDSPPVLQRQNAVVSLSSEAPAAVAPPALPRMAHPTLERVAGTVDIMDSVVLGEKAMQYESELKLLEASVWTVADMSRRERLGRAYRGGWTTLPDGRKVMLWAFHAFAEPAHPVDYRKPCSLVHLGLYNITDRSLDTSEAPPALPKNQENWPW